MFNINPNANEELDGDTHDTAEDHNECVRCLEPIHEYDLALTKVGPMHEDCAELIFPADHGDSMYPH